VKYTDPRLIAGFLIAMLAGLVAETLKGVMPSDTGFGNLTVISMVIGLVVGWFVMGSRAGSGMIDAISNGVTTAISLAFCGLLVQASYEMLRLSLMRRYDGVVEAIVAVFEIMLRFGAHLVDVKVITTLLVGGIVAALITEYAHQRWS